MSDDSWEKVVVAIVAGLPAIIAAISSVKNGRKLDDAKKELKIANGRRKSRVRAVRDAKV